MNHLNQLEEKSIYLLREAYYHSPNRLALLWSIGKDSTVLLWLVRKAFLGQIPFPLLHIDTHFKIPAMIQFRDQMVKKLKLDMIVGSNTIALKQKQTFPDGQISRTECCSLLKTFPLENVTSNSIPRDRYNHTSQAYQLDLSGQIFTSLIMGIRADEEPSRSKERYFSVRASDGSWKIEDMPAEIWDEFNHKISMHEKLRIHPLLDWSEKNIWEYIHREKIPVTELYFDQGDQTRYRSLGCWPCTSKIQSNSKNPEDIIFELSEGSLARHSERAGREQDKEGGNSLETLRRQGYM